MMRWMSRFKLQFRETGAKQALTLFIVMRIFLSLWAVVALSINPLPQEADEVVRPYLGEPPLTNGIAGHLLGPWQRFDAQRYMHIARQGYVEEQNSVFPPLYPLSVRALGNLLGGSAVNYLLAGILLSNLACLGLFTLLYKVASVELDSRSATRAMVYLAVFPTGFFLFAPYTESLFMLLALGSLWAARNGRFWQAGILGFLSALTRLTGWVLVIPLAYEYWQQHRAKQSVSQSRSIASRTMLRALHPSLLATILPGIAIVVFLLWRWQAGLPPINVIYEKYWYQTTGYPGADLISAIKSLFFGGTARSNELIALALDLSATILLISTTVIAFRQLGITYGLYSAMLLLFMLLPSSDVKPLYSFSRYTLAFFPTFMLMAKAGERPSVNRLILYPSLLLYLYFSGQFFAWGWVA